MEADQIFFGVELETTIPAHDTTPIGPYHHGIQVPWLPLGWKAERDGSIRALVPGRKGCEFVSPKLKGAAGLREVEEAIDAINARGGRVNLSCGLHLTIQFDGDAAALARLISLVGNHEKSIFASTGTRRRERAVYSKKIKAYGNKDRAKERCESDRYHLLNLTHLARGQNRIEFRAFAGTLNKSKAIGHLLMVLGLVELALTSRRCADWDYAKRDGAKSCWDRPGAGDCKRVVPPPKMAAVRPAMPSLPYWNGPAKCLSSMPKLSVRRRTDSLLHVRRHDTSFCDIRSR